MGGFLSGFGMPGLTQAGQTMTQYGQAAAQMGQMGVAPRPQARITTTVVRQDPYTGQQEVIDTFRGRPHLTPGDLRGYRKVKKLAQRAARVRRKYTTYSRAKRR